MSADIIKNLESFDVKANPVFALGQILRNMQLIPTRDSFTLERGNDQNQLETVTFKRGELVKFELSKMRWKTAEITGISYADRKFKANGQWIDFGYAYKADYDEFKQYRDKTERYLIDAQKALDQEKSIPLEYALKCAAESAAISTDAKLIAQVRELQIKSNELSQKLRSRYAVEKAATEEALKKKKADELEAIRSREPEPDIEMTMEEWKKVHRDFKGRIDGQRTVMPGGRIRGVKIVKPAKFDSIGGFDSAGSEVDYTSLAAFNGLNESKVQSDPIKALELCLSVMPINAARQFIAPAQFNAKDYADTFSDHAVTAEKILQNFPPDTADKMQTIIEDLKGITTTDIIFKRPDGKYKPERKTVQDAILYEGVTKHGEFKEPIIPNEYTLARYLPDVSEKPVFIILGGRGGSGKSSFNGTVYNPPACLVLDADSIKERLPEYEGWNANEVHEESSDLLDRALEKAREYGINVVLDATMKTAETALKNIDDFKKAGYRIEAHYMFLPRQEAAKRAVGRFLNPDGGRFVPIDIILKNTTNEDAFEQVKPLVDKWSFRDNNVPFGSKPILISSSD